MRSNDYIKGPELLQQQLLKTRMKKPFQKKKKIDQFCLILHFLFYLQQIRKFLIVVLFTIFKLISLFRVRIGLHWFVTRPFFDGFIMFVILLSSVALALEDPVKEDSDRNKKLGLLDYGFTAIFAIECLLKMLDLGMFLHPGAYLRDIWNVMDISVVSCAILSFYFK